MKAQTDSIYLVVRGFMVVLVISIILFVWQQISQNPTAQQQLFNQTSQGQALVKNTTTAINYIANGIIFVWILSGIASCIAARFVGSSAVFAVPGLVIMPIVGLLGFIFHDTFFIMLTTSPIGGIAAAVPNLITFMQYYPFIAMALSFIIIVVTYTKPT